MRTLFSPLHEFLKKGDLVLLSLCLLTSGFGVALIFSATRYNQNNRPVVIQCVAILLGVAVYLLCTFVDFQLFVEKNWKWLFGGSVFFLLLLLTPLGNDHNSGNLNWLDIPGFPLEIQPNEIIKIPFILLLSLQITKIQDRGQSISSLPSLVQIGGHAAFMLALIAGICGDMGMCVVYLFIFAVMAWGAGVKKALVSCWRAAPWSSVLPCCGSLFCPTRRPGTACTWSSASGAVRPLLRPPRGSVFSRPAPSWLWAPGSCSARATSTGT